MGELEKSWLETLSNKPLQLVKDDTYSSQFQKFLP